jgi:hypothetical protein
MFIFDIFSIAKIFFCSRHYFVLLCNMEPLEIFMEYYNKLVPHIYIPEPAVMEVCSGFVLIRHVEGQPILLLFGWGGLCVVSMEYAP